MIKNTLSYNELGQFAPNKILQHLDRIKDYLDGKNISPITVEIDPSGECNHNCLRCTFEAYHKNSMLSEELMKGLADDFSELGVKAVLWTGGGEPLMNRAMPNVFQYFAEKKIEQGIATNGALVTANHIALFADHFEFVRFSVDAASDKMHQRVHRPINGKNDFSKIKKTIKDLCKKRVGSTRKFDVGFSFLTHPENYKELYDAAKLSKDWGVNYFQIKPVVMHRKDQISTDYLEKCFHYIHTTKDLETDSFKVIVLDYKFEDLVRRDFTRTYEFCWGHPFMTTVSADGYVNFCCHTRGLKEYTFGKVTEKQRFRDVWEGPDRKEAIDRMKRDGLTKCPPNCKYHMMNQILQEVVSSQVGIHKNFL